AAALVAHGLRAFDADERRGIAGPAELRRDLVGDHLAVGEDLEVAVGVGLEEPDQVGVHERLPAQDPEEAVAVLLRIRISRSSSSNESMLAGLSTSTQQP